MPVDDYVWPVALRLRDGTEIRNIPSIDVQHDMLSPGSAWAATLWWSKERGSEWREIRRKCVCGEMVFVEIGGATQMLGRIEETTVNAEGHNGGLELTLSGRDIIGRLIDWDADPRTQLRNTTLEEAIAALCDPFGVRVYACEAAAEREARGLPRRGRRTRTNRPRRRNVIDTTRIQIGQRVWEVIDKLCRANGFLVWGAPTEYSNTIELVIDKPASASPPVFAFERVSQPDGTYRGNMLKGRHQVSTRNVPTEVTAFGHTALASGSDARLQRTVFNDRLVSPYVVAPDAFGPQPRFLRPDQARTEAAIGKAAERTFAQAMGDWRSYDVRVRGFGQLVGDQRRLYTQNTGARVRDDCEEPAIDENMLIRSVHFHESRERGQITELVLVPDGAITVTPDET
jgi:prophage tail gpP-like protein